MPEINQETGYLVESFTFSLVRQGTFRFYSLTLPSKFLAETCFVTTRFDDPVEGFQRLLDDRRAQEIADYIDNNLAPIPNSVVLSAQPEARLKEKPGGRVLTVEKNPKAFLILDGQHRVYGFAKAKTELRVPVIIFEGLTRQQETRLFIDINTKQKPVPSELLLDIKRLADVESDEESRLREIFDLFNSEPSSILLGELSPNERVTGKLSRVSFNAACKPVLRFFSDRPVEEVFEILNGYLAAFRRGLMKVEMEGLIISPYGFKAVLGFLPVVASRVKDRFGGYYSADHFSDVLSDMFENISRAQLVGAKSSAKALQDLFARAMNRGFQL